MGSCQTSAPKYVLSHVVSYPPITITRGNKVASLSFPLPAYTAALVEELRRALGLASLDTISGFLVDPDVGGPLCPMDMFYCLRGASPVEAVVAQIYRCLDLRSMNEAREMKLHFGPLPPLAFADFNVDSEFASAAAQLGTPESGRLSARLVEGLLHQGFVRLTIDAEFQRKVDDAKQAAASFWALDATARLRARSQLRDGKYLGFVADGAREFVQMRLSEHGMQWPCGAEDLSKPFVVLFHMLRGLAIQCIRLLAQGLALDVQYVTDMLDGPTSGTLDPCEVAPSSQRGDGIVGADVFRVYRYFRAAGQPLPGLRHAATSLHCDMGLLTLTPASTFKGLSMLSPDGTCWMDCEEGAQPNHIFLFLGETLARLAADPFSLARQGSVITSASATVSSNSSTQSHQSILRTTARGSNVPADATPSEANKCSFIEQKSSHQRGCLRAPMHFVDEKVMGLPRYSFPFFLRARPDAKIRPDLTVAQFMENQVLSARPWSNPKRNRVDY